MEILPAMWIFSEPHGGWCHLRERDCGISIGKMEFWRSESAESADSQILNQNRGHNRLESDLQPTTLLATFRGLAGTFWPIIVARP